ncbi:MAG: hypothetical protein HQL45_17645 [Alphaproteobacteria bacterium]|nr:hypothetical protein [Alphaproteobacteria bacterium]
MPIVDFDEQHFVTYAAKKQRFSEHDRVQTFQLGKGEVVIRVYDKVAEIVQQSGKSWFFDLWGQKENVWRVEFQARGERLKEGGIHTLQDLRDHQGDLLRGLATCHTRLCVPQDDGNRSRWPLHPLWAAVTKDIAKFTYTGLIRELDQQSTIAWRLHQQGKAVYGYLKGISALLMERDGIDQPPDLRASLARLPALLIPHHQPLEWTGDIQTRHSALRLGQW